MSRLLRPDRSVRRRKPEKDSNGLRRTPVDVETCAGLSQACLARLPDSFHDTGDNGPRMPYLYMAAVLFTGPALDLFDNCYSTFRLPSTLPGHKEVITPPCSFPSIVGDLADLARIPIPAEAGRELSHFRCCRGCDFAFMVNNTGLEPATNRLIVYGSTIELIARLPFKTCTSCGSIAF
jgi:hypothetical protein